MKKFEINDLLCILVAVEFNNPCNDLELCLSNDAKSFCPCFLNVASMSGPQHCPPHMFPVTLKQTKNYKFVINKQHIRCPANIRKLFKYSSSLFKG